MATAWITGICLRPNRLEWTTLRRAKEVWEIVAQGQEDVPAAEGAGGWIPAAALKARLKQFKGRVAVALRGVVACVHASTSATSQSRPAMDRPKITVNSAIRAGVARPLSDVSAMPR